MLLSELKLLEAKKNTFQVKVEGSYGGNWQDIELYADSLDDIVASVGATPGETDKHAKFDARQKTTVTKKGVITIMPGN